MHLLYIFVVLASLPLTLLYEPYRFFAFSLVFGTIVAWSLSKFDCPLTVLENTYRKQYDAEQVKPDYISYYLRRAFRMPFSSRIVWFSAYAYLAAIIIAAI